MFDGLFSGIDSLLCAQEAPTKKQQRGSRGLQQVPVQTRPQEYEVASSNVDPGGSVWTLQKGFEGIFGHHANSKEEVLRRRGPQIATEYEAVPGDDIDQRVQFFARKLKADVAGEMKIFRIGKGDYEIDGHRVLMSWGNRRKANGQTGREIFVSPVAEDGTQDKDTAEVLAYYLGHSANVGHAMRTGGASLNQVPDHVRMSFNTPGADIQQADSTNRYTAMQVAAEQAKMREQMAQEWKSRNLTSVPENTPVRRAESPVRTMERTQSHLMVSPHKARASRESPAKPAGPAGAPMPHTPPPAAAFPMQQPMPHPQFGVQPQFGSMYHQPQLSPQFASMYHSYGGQLSPEFGSMYMNYR